MPTFLDGVAGAGAFRVEACGRIEDLAKAHAANHIKGPDHCTSDSATSSIMQAYLEHAAALSKAAIIGNMAQEFMPDYAGSHPVRLLHLECRHWAMHVLQL